MTPAEGARLRLDQLKVLNLASCPASGQVPNPSPEGKQIRYQLTVLALTGVHL
ncbi:hypothetical protein DEMA109039_18425 [Deinococcus marmoris]